MKQFFSHALMQIRQSLREPAYFFSTLLLPVGLYGIFAVPESNNVFISSYLVYSFCAFAFFGVIFFQYSINTVQEKKSTWSNYLKTIPTKQYNLTLARYFTSILLGTISCGLIHIIAYHFTPADLTISAFIKMIIFLTIGSVPFLLMGLVIGSIFTSRAVVPIISFLHLALAYAGGLWKPINLLPQAIQKLAPMLPTYHFGSLVWSLSSQSSHIEKQNVTYLVTFTTTLLFTLVILNYKTKSFKKNQLFAKS